MCRRDFKPVENARNEKTIVGVARQSMKQEYNTKVK